MADVTRADDKTTATLPQTECFGDRVAKADIRGVGLDNYYISFQNLKTGRSNGANGERSLRMIVGDIFSGIKLGFGWIGMTTKEREKFDRIIKIAATVEEVNEADKHELSSAAKIVMLIDEVRKAAELGSRPNYDYVIKKVMDVNTLPPHFCKELHDITRLGNCDGSPANAVNLYNTISEHLRAGRVQLLPLSTSAFTKRRTAFFEAMKKIISMYLFPGKAELKHHRSTLPGFRREEKSGEKSGNNGKVENSEKDSVAMPGMLYHDGVSYRRVFDQPIVTTECFSNGHTLATYTLIPIPGDYEHPRFLINGKLYESLTSSSLVQATASLSPSPDIVSELASQTQSQIKDDNKSAAKQDLPTSASKHRSGDGRHHLQAAIQALSLPRMSPEARDHYLGNRILNGWHFQNALFPKSDQTITEDLLAMDQKNLAATSRQAKMAAHDRIVRNWVETEREKNINAVLNSKKLADRTRSRNENIGEKLRTQTNQPREVHICRTCHKTFPGPLSLVKHIEIMHAMKFTPKEVIRSVRENQNKMEKNPQIKPEIKEQSVHAPENKACSSDGSWVLAETDDDDGDKTDVEDGDWLIV